MTLLHPITFHVRRSRGEMCSGHSRLCVCLSASRRIPALLHGPGCKLGNGRECPLVVHYCADLQSVHGFLCYDNIAPNAKCQRVLVLALCLVLLLSPPDMWRQSFTVFVGDAVNEIDEIWQQISRRLHRLSERDQI